MHAERCGICPISEHVFCGRMIFIQNIDSVSHGFGRDCVMDYSIEIELPRSGAWFKYFTNIDTLEEAKSVKQAAKGTVKARILKNV